MTRRKKYSGGNLTTHINYGAKLLSYCKSESWTKTNVGVGYGRIVCQKEPTLHEYLLTQGV